MLSNKSIRPLILILVIGILYFYVQDSYSVSDRSESNLSEGSATIKDLFDRQVSGELVQFSGTVTRQLPDDNEGSRHQRFIVSLDSGQSILVSHNIDLAQRVPIETGDSVGIRGEYEWNDPRRGCTLDPS